MLITWNAGPAIVEMEIKDLMKSLKTVAELQALKSEVKQMKGELDMYIPATVVARIDNYIDIARNNEIIARFS